MYDMENGELLCPVTKHILLVTTRAGTPPRGFTCISICVWMNNIDTSVADMVTSNKIEHFLLVSMKPIACILICVHKFHTDTGQSLVTSDKM